MPQKAKATGSRTLYYNASREKVEAITRIMTAETRDTITNVLDVLISEALKMRKQKGKAH